MLYVKQNKTKQNEAAPTAAAAEEIKKYKQ